MIKSIVMNEIEVRIKCLELAFGANPGKEDSAKKLAQQLYDWVIQNGSQKKIGQ